MRLTEDGYAVRAGGHVLALSGGGNGGTWTRHGGGVTRPTAFGAETITVTPCLLYTSDAADE